jgi:hypothetical protein
MGMRIEAKRIAHSGMRRERRDRREGILRS